MLSFFLLCFVKAIEVIGESLGSHPFFNDLWVGGIEV